MTIPPPPGYPRVSPYLNYEDTGAMLDWLARAYFAARRDLPRKPDGSE